MRISSGTIALSWGRNGGVYAVRKYVWRICLWRVALTYVPIEIDELMRGYAGVPGRGADG